MINICFLPLESSLSHSNHLPLSKKEDESNIGEKNKSQKQADLLSEFLRKNFSLVDCVDKGVSIIPSETLRYRVQVESQIYNRTYDFEGMRSFYTGKVRYLEQQPLEHHKPVIAILEMAKELLDSDYLNSYTFLSRTGKIFSNEDSVFKNQEIETEKQLKIQGFSSRFSITAKKTSRYFMKYLVENRSFTCHNFCRLTNYIFSNTAPQFDIYVCLFKDVDNCFLLVKFSPENEPPSENDLILDIWARSYYPFSQKHLRNPSPPHIIPFHKGFLHTPFVDEIPSSDKPILSKFTELEESQFVTPLIGWPLDKEYLFSVLANQLSPKFTGKGVLRMLHQSLHYGYHEVVQKICDAGLLKELSKEQINAFAEVVKQKYGVSKILDILLKIPEFCEELTPDNLACLQRKLKND